MTVTHPRVTFGLFDLAFKREATLYASALQPFAKLDDLRTDNISPRPYATYEPDFWLLDGEYKFLPEDDTTVHVGLMSEAISGADGLFYSTPYLMATFEEPHDLTSLSLRFSPVTGDYCNHITVDYYDEFDEAIRSDEYYPTSPEFSTNQAVTGFSKVVITLWRTHRPYRYLRLTGLDFGEFVTFTGAQILGATLTEEVDQLSQTLPSNMVDLQLYSADAQFSLLAPGSDYEQLAEGQPVDVYELVDGARVPMGKFYLMDWENLSDTNYRFRAVDLIGKLDRTPYRGGIWLGDGIAIETLIEQMLSAINVPYELDYHLLGDMVRGWLPICSYREALQQIGFAVGASITCSRSGILRITRSRLAATDTPTRTIAKGEKGIESPVSLKPLVTGVEVLAHDYVPSGEVDVVATADFDVGRHEVVFSQPMHTVMADSGVIVESGVNYAVIDVSMPGACSISGLRYIDSTSRTGVYATGLSAAVQPNVLQVEYATLVHPGNAQAVAQRVYDYHQQRLVQKTKLFAPRVEPGDIVEIDTLYSRKIRAVVEFMKSDLTRGFVANTEMTGVVSE